MEEIAIKEFENVGDEKLFPNHTDKDIWIAGFKKGTEWQQEQILEFLYLEITERRDYSASKMCEKVIEFIEQFKK
jgi:hypothetical protein